MSRTHRRFLNQRRAFAAAALGICAGSSLLAGCAPWATYPPVETTADLAQPTYEPFPTLMALAVIDAHNEWGTVDEGIVYNLPVGTPLDVYEKVNRRLDIRLGQKDDSPSARPMSESDPAGYHILAVRTRGTDAEVDVIYPRADGLPELVTIYYSRSLVRDFSVDRFRPWRIRVETPMASYDQAVRDEAAANEPAPSDTSSEA